MKQRTPVKNIASKGDRLNWTPLKDVKRVRLDLKSIKGKKVPSSVLCSQASSSKGKLLVP